ncbi:MAG TPA: hypothetical protein VK011_01995, partial [Acidimicrobiia bacterium]|nr:hypothetical protein [Acidimicrobiia bacterium]
DEILRADIEARYRAHQIGITAGFKTINEARKEEGLTAVAGGDQIREQAGAATLTPREQAEVVQKVYLGVGKVLTSEEARRIIQTAGVDIEAIPLPAEEGAVVVPASSVPLTAVDEETPQNAPTPAAAP